jgi:hypothetical protein
MRLDKVTLAIAVGCLLACGAALGAEQDATPNPFVFRLEIPAPEDSAGGLAVHDLDGDGKKDFLVTVPGHVAAYANDGSKLWILEKDVRIGSSSENVGLPGHNGPGVQAADIDGDGGAEVLFLTQDNVLHAVDGAQGTEEWTATYPAPEGAERWEHLVILNLRGQGDRDLLLQTTNKDGYRMGHYLAAFSLDDLRAGKVEPLWQREGFLTCAHNGARVADLDGDGLDEILGGMILGQDGKETVTIPLKGHIDSIFVRDVRPEIPGLEVVALEEGGGNRVFLYNKNEVLWESHYQHWEPQNAAVGEFDPNRPGLEIWCRSRYNEDQKPFVFDSKGEPFAQYEMKDVAPEGWTRAGVEIINSIDWTGEKHQLAAATERHMEGDLCVFDPVSGKFIATFDTEAARFYVADVSGDWREELIALAGNELRIYRNEEPNPNPDRASLWEDAAYTRSKMTHNYYSP